jgi:GntR family transcriptional regulator, transcriptional repressor for pyruvate dehydrogenase complex
MRPPAYQMLADDLRAQITSGRLRPGDRLPTEPQLCARTGVSRSTVREALRLLASQHLIVTTRGVTGGSFVAHPSTDMLADTLATGVRLLLRTSIVSAAELLEMREMLEVPAAGLAATRRDTGQLAALAAALFDPDRDDLDTILAAHRTFHLALAACTGNGLYEAITQPLYSVANERELVTSQPADLWVRIDAEHRAILRAIAAGDPEAARSAAARHVAHLRERLRASEADRSPLG